MKKTISVLLALVLLLGAFPFALPAAAADDPQTYSGTCGSNIEWTLEDGVLTVSGDGAIEPQKRPSTVDNVTWNEATQKIEYTTSPFVSEGSFPWDDVLVRIYTEHFGVDPFSGLLMRYYTDDLTANDIMEFMQEQLDSVRSIVIGEGITSISSNAFSQFLPERIVLPSTLTSIESYAFHAAITTNLVVKNPALDFSQGGISLVGCYNGENAVPAWFASSHAYTHENLRELSTSAMIEMLSDEGLRTLAQAAALIDGYGDAAYKNYVMQPWREYGIETPEELAAKMIEIFNPTISYELKCDEDFVRGLLVHLRPVIIRLYNHMNIFNPILKDIREEYPDVFRRCALASKVIEREVREVVHDEEIGFLAMHFGAAEERILERQKAARRVVIGVICASGFGVARLMLTKLSNHLGDKATFRAYGKDEITPDVIADTDFFVSTLNLDSLGIDCVRVSPLITASDLSQIEYRIKGYGQVRRRRQDTNFVRQMDEVGVIAGDLSSLIRKYRHYEIAPNVSFRELLRVLSIQVTDSLAAASKVIDAVTERERLNSQIFPELGFCLLHSRTDAVRDTVFVSCSPRGHDHFSDKGLKGIRAAVLMLMPIDDHRSIHAEVLGRISSAFIKNEVFLEAVQNGKQDVVRTELTHELRTFFSEYVEKI